MIEGHELTTAVPLPMNSQHVELPPGWTIHNARLMVAINGKVLPPDSYKVEWIPQDNSGQLWRPKVTLTALESGTMTMWLASGEGGA